MERGPFPFLDISFKSNEISKRRTGDIGILMRRHSWIFNFILHVTIGNSYDYHSSVVPLNEIYTLWPMRSFSHSLKMISWFFLSIFKCEWEFINIRRHSWRLKWVMQCFVLQWYVQWFTQTISERLLKSFKVKIEKCTATWT